MDKNLLADQYFSSIRNRNLDGLIAFFAKDASMLLPDGQALAGADAIREMYRGLMDNQAPSPTPVTIINGEAAIAAEIEIHLPDGRVRRTANFFHLNSENLIQRLHIYARS